MAAEQPAARRGTVDRPLAAEYPGLRLDWLVADCLGSASDPGVAERLALLADRFSGRQALTLRQSPVVSAYRSFFWQIGIDPDSQQTPAEAVALERLQRGGNPLGGRVADALRLAVLETSVAIYGFDAGAVAAPPMIRAARQGEQADGRALAAGTIVLADRERALCELFTPPGGDCAAGRHSSSVLLAAIGVDGVGELPVAEALSIAAGALSGG